MSMALKSRNVNIEIFETYPKQTFRNRCNIASSTGNLSLSVPVKRINGNHTITADILIDNSKPWQQIHWRSIVSAYNKSPYFLFYRDLFEPVYKTKQERLIDLNQSLLDIVLKLLKVNNLKINFNDNYVVATECLDFRNAISPKLKQIQKNQNYFPRYMQVFEDIHGFIPELSIIDLLFNLGPEALPYLTDYPSLFQAQINEL